MSSFPENKHEMLRAGYKFLGRSTCKGEGCGQQVDWWKTTNGRKMPFNRMDDENRYAPAVTHFASCPASEEFKFRHPEAAAKPAAKPAPGKGYAPNVGVIRRLQHASGARCIVALYDDGATYAWRNGIPAEDLRNEIITAANDVRNQLLQKEEVAR